MRDKQINSFADKMCEGIPDIAREVAKREAKSILHTKVSISQLFLLELLVKTGDMPMSKIAREMGLSLPAITGITDKLVRDNFVIRLSSPKDRRVILIRVTLKGKEAVEKINNIRRKFIFNSFAKLTAKERNTYLAIITKLRNVLKDKSDKEK